jgi:hypothetical protein
MPKVGKMSFPYTAKGMAAAKTETKKSGKKMVMGKSTMKMKKMGKKK